MGDRLLPKLSARASPPWHIGMLGALTLVHEGETRPCVRNSKVGSLLAYLAYHDNRAHAREELLELFWPDRDPHLARQCLRQALSAIRRTLQTPSDSSRVLLATHACVRLDPALVTTDVHAFRAAMDTADRTTDPAERLSLLRQAVDLYQGDLLPGYYDDWLLIQREELRVVYLRALSELVVTWEQRGELRRALEYALQAVAAAPLDEALRYEAIRLYAQLGQPQLALRQYYKLVRVLKEELGVSPAPRTRELVRVIKRQVPRPSKEEPTRARRPGPRPTPPRQAPPQSSNPPPALSDTCPRLPLRLTRFFGRESELSRIIALLHPHRDPSGRAGDGCRLLTLTGPGGAGKTRLALEAAERLATAYASPVHFVALTDLPDAARLPDRILDAVGVKRSSAEPAMALAVKALSDRPTLLVLDNFEHLVEGGACVVWSLLERVPTLACLVTSRRCLGLMGEQELAVKPLPVPNKPGTRERLLEFPAVEMFVNRAQIADPAFQLTSQNATLVAALCRKLEGLPLAIELAAARAGTFPPAKMLDALTDRFRFLRSRWQNVEPRHRTLRAAIDWSFDLLSSEHQRFLARLSVFQGGWTPEAAPVVCATDATADAVDELEQLVHRSLLTAERVGEDIRFSMKRTRSPRTV